MKQRIISAAIGLIVLAIVLIGFETLLLNVVISAISLIALWELFSATGYRKHVTLTAIAGIYAVIYPFFREFFGGMDLLPIVTLFYMIALLVVLLKEYSKVTFQEVLVIGAFGLLIPVSFTNFVFLRDNLGWEGGIFCSLMILGSAWFSDTCAYFTGRFFGKHKLAPVISPKKTIEGLIGGLFGSVLCNMGLAWGYTYAISMMGIQSYVNYPMIASVTFLGSIVSVIGDLSASAIKRQCGIKDFGNIMPGHGGVMDRFDSVLLTSPVVYLLSCFVPLITIL